MIARLAGFELHQVEDGGLAGQQEVVETQQGLRALGERPRGPARLCGARTRDRGLNVFRCQARD